MNRSRAYSAVLSWICVAISCSSLLGQRNLRNIPDPDPGLQLAEMEVAPGFEINLFAADPRIAKPIQMNFDPAGRLWIASSEVYPQIKPGQKADDKILVIEDQDHDGFADSTTIFARGLLIPTGVEPGDGGAYVANSTELLHLTDTDGDGVADQERVVLSGFGTEDTHHILHTLRWGPEGLLYMNQSIYIHSHIETPYGVRRMNGGGIWHFRPETMELETYTLGLVNSWGHAIDKFGQSMATDGAGGEGINYVFPGFVGVTSPGAKRIMQGLNPGKPKLCGLEMVGGSHLPEDWRGNLITNDFRAHRVCRYVLTEAGAGYAARELDELVKTRHPAFRPIDVKLGPDGAIYIADWYNPIIQHGEVDFRDPRRDHTHGRIWRISATNRPPLAYKNLYEESTTSLLDLLQSDEPYWRQQAKRVLKERGGGDIMPYLTHIRRRDLAERAKLEILWVYQTLDIVNSDLVAELLEAKDPRIRAAAVRVLYHWQHRVPKLQDHLAKAATDDHPRVRMEAAHALRRSNVPSATPIALTAIARPTDRFLEYALQQTADQTQSKWLPALRKGELTFGDNSAGLIFALKAADTADAIPLLLGAAASWKDDPQATSEVMTMVAARGNADQLSEVFDRAVAKQTSTKLRVALLNALIDAAKRRKLQPNADLANIRSLWQDESPDVQAAALEAAGRWQLPSAGGDLFRYADDQQRPVVRTAAIRGLAALQDLGRLKQLDSDHRAPLTRVTAVSNMAGVDLNAAATRAARLLSKLTEKDDPARLVRAFLSKDGGDMAFAEAIASANSSISADVAKLCVRAAGSSGRDVSALSQQLRQAGGLDSEPKPLTAEQRQQLLTDAAADGDPAAGEAIYRRKKLNCQVCHAIGGAGGQVGPDLASIGASAPADYILESLLDPSAKIKENYHSLVVATDDGQVITGVKVRETEEALILRDAADQLVLVPLDSIEAQQDGGSLMPAGLTGELTQQEMVDLLRFLTELGKVGDYALPREPYIRSWQTLAAEVNRELLTRFGELAIVGGARAQFEWEPAYSNVAGSVPLHELPDHRPRFAEHAVKYLRFLVAAPSDADRQLILSRTNGVRIYLDERMLDTAQQVTLIMTADEHWITLAIDEVPGAKDINVKLD